MLKVPGSCQSNWWDVPMLVQRMMLTVRPDTGDWEAVLNLGSWPTFAPSFWMVKARNNCDLCNTQLFGFPWSESKKYSKLVNYTEWIRDYQFVLLEIVPMLDVFLCTLRLGRRLVQSMMKGIPIYQTGQAALSQAFRPCRTETMGTEESAFKKLFKWQFVIIPPLSFNVTNSNSIMD